MMREFRASGVRGAVALALGAATLVASACGGSTASGTASTPRATETTARVTTSVPTPPSTGGTPAAKAASTGTSATQAGAVRKVNANTASRAEIQAALEAAGVPAAANWAREVTEYRPYATTDTNWDKLRGELVKYNPGPGVVDQIIAVLEK